MSPVEWRANNNRRRNVWPSVEACVNVFFVSLRNSCKELFYCWFHVATTKQYSYISSAALVLRFRQIVRGMTCNQLETTQNLCMHPTRCHCFWVVVCVLHCCDSRQYSVQSFCSRTGRAAKTWIETLVPPLRWPCACICFVVTFWYNWVVGFMCLLFFNFCASCFFQQNGNGLRPSRWSSRQHSRHFLNRTRFFSYHWFRRVMATGFVRVLMTGLVGSCFSRWFWHVRIRKFAQTFGNETATRP